MSYTIKAKVFDKNMTPLTDANIVEVRQDGKVNNARTDENGKFTIVVPSKDSIVKISHVGFITEQFKANDEALYSYVELREDPNWLDPVIVNAKEKKPNYLLWFLIGAATLGTGYYLYKKNQPKKVRV